VEVILVDSGSTDATAAIAAQYGAKIVHIQPDEFTFGRSLNLGLAAATCDRVAIASAHVYPVYPDWLECLLEPFDDSVVALTYGKQRGNEHSKFSENQIFSRWFPDQLDPRQKNTFCNNANAAVRHSVWEIHPYDETLTGLEDLSWANWAKEQGHAITYVPNAEIIHVHDETRRAVLNRYRREGMAFKKIYPEAHFSLYDFVRMSTANISSIFWFRAAQFWGTYQGYRHSLEWNWQLRQTFYFPHGRQAPEKPAPRPIEPIRYNE
jgi:glycosyltransferase involved in cell wall biosynthesis